MSRPVLAIVYGAGSASAMKLAGAARELGDLVWVVDSATFADPTMMRLLRKLGTIVDVAGLTDDEAAAALGARAPNGIVAYADAQIGLASMLAEKLALDYHDRVVAERLLDKTTQRRALAAAGLPVPRCIDVPPAITTAGIDALTDGMSFPMVLKPRHGAASRDTVLVRDAAELAQRLAEAPGGAADGAMVIEEYMAGAAPPPSADFADYVSVESIIAAGRISHLCVTGRTPQVPPFRETGYVIPSDFPAALIADALALATEALVALGPRTGCFHTEIKATPDGLRVIEVNGRIGGFVAEVLEVAAPGVNLFEISQRIALGEQLTYPDVVTSADRIGYLVVEQPPLTAKAVAGVSGLDRLEKYDGVASVTLSRQPGDAVDWRKGSHELVYAVIGAAADYEQVQAARKFIEEAVSITYT